MTGNVIVQEAPTGYKVIHNVGADVGDGKTTFDVQYQSIKNIISAEVGVKDKSLNLVLVGQTNQSSTLVLNLPTDLIATPLLGVQVDGAFTTNFTETDLKGMTVLTIPITPVTEQVSIIGTQVVPEFGPIAALVLAISIFTTSTVYEIYANPYTGIAAPFIGLASSDAKKRITCEISIGVTHFA